MPSKAKTVGPLKFDKLPPVEVEGLSLYALDNPGLGPLVLRLGFTGKVRQHYTHRALDRVFLRRMAEDVQKSLFVTRELMGEPANWFEALKARLGLRWRPKPQKAQVIGDSVTIRVPPAGLPCRLCYRRGFLMRPDSELLATCECQE